MFRKIAELALKYWFPLAVIAAVIVAYQIFGEWALTGLVGAFFGRKQEVPDDIDEHEQEIARAKQEVLAEHARAETVLKEKQKVAEKPKDYAEEDDSFLDDLNTRQ